MKKLFISAMLLLCVSAFSQTTMEEYNYVTKGYAIQISSGLDMKKGYIAESYGGASYQSSFSIRYFNFKKLIRTTTNTTAAIIIETYKSNDLTTKEYYCVPLLNSSVDIDRVWMSDYNRAINGNYTTAFGYAMTVLSQKLMTEMQLQSTNK